MRSPECVDKCGWAAGGYTAQAIGLEYTTASRGAFTGTFTVLAVPILVGLSGRKVPWTTWAAAAVALTGRHLLHALYQDLEMLSVVMQVQHLQCTCKLGQFCMSRCHMPV